MFERDVKPKGIRLKKSISLGKEKGWYYPGERPEAGNDGGRFNMKQMA